MKLLSVAAFSAVLVVPCFANAKVSAGSPNLPYPRDLGRGIVAGSPNRLSAQRHRDEQSESALPA